MILKNIWTKVNVHVVNKTKLYWQTVWSLKLLKIVIYNKECVCSIGIDFQFFGILINVPSDDDGLYCTVNVVDGDVGNERTTG